MSVACFFTSSYVSSWNGAGWPGRWQPVQFWKIIGAMSLAKVNWPAGRGGGRRKSAVKPAHSKWGWWPGQNGPWPVPSRSTLPSHELLIFRIRRQFRHEVLHFLRLALVGDQRRVVRHHHDRIAQTHDG